MWDLDGGGIDLYLPLNAYDEDSNPFDKYWTGTLDKNDTEKCFYFAPAIDWELDYYPIDIEYVHSEPMAKTDTYLVRLFHDL